MISDSTIRHGLALHEVLAVVLRVDLFLTHLDRALRGELAIALQMALLTVCHGRTLREVLAVALRVDIHLIRLNRALREVLAIVLQICDAGIPT